MASLPVNNSLKALTNIVNQAANVQNYQNAAQTRQEDAGADSFGQVMNRMNAQENRTADVQTSNSANTKATATVGKTMTTGVVSVKTSKADVTAKPDTAAKTDTAAEAGKTPVSEKDAAGQTEQSAAEKNVSEKDVAGEELSAQEEAVVEAGEKLVEAVAEQMGISVEEVEEVMEVLGLSAVQLLVPENMKQLLLTLSGNEDYLSIVTDGELYGHFQNLLDTVEMTLEELGAELGLSDEEVNTLIADLSVVETGADVPQELLAQMTEDGTDEAPVMEGAKDYAVVVHEDGETVSVKVTVDDVSGQETVKAEITEPSRLQNKQESETQNHHKEGEGRETNGFVMQTPIEQLGINEAPQPVVERFVSTEDIMNQITEYLKINLKGDVQELELQLHPASLGTVNVQIASKDGMITAHFTAQNEAVKSAIEGQIVQLKTQFEEQGIKVNAVEVSVGDYRFGQSFSNDGGNAPGNQEESRKSRRRINLNELDLEELPEDMDDSERIAAEMMANSGNTVDYTA
ncbi:MAG: flagellar hook-length control protein FliK [Blautia sp.]|nr:flagellar hook-length control protein FliK [Lachnoclostridium sp.]MCM1210382.1 flagellar hook-length control protein FliK [Blautia sp.]